MSGNYYLCEGFQESEDNPLPESFPQIKEWSPKSELCREQGHHHLYVEIRKTSTVFINIF